MELAYPTCAFPDDTGSFFVAELASGSTSLERNILELFEFLPDGCGHTRVTVAQRWRLSNDDVEVIFDEGWLPLRAWKRMTVPGSPRPDGHGDIRRYELRMPEVTIKRRTPDGEIVYEVLKPSGRTQEPGVLGMRPTAVIGPGRGLLTAWLKRARLSVGSKSREWVLDFREMVEKLQQVTLRRDEDRNEPTLGRTVRVYTIYGRESVFADENDVVVGDLGGLRTAQSLGVAPIAIRYDYGAPDPKGTP